MSLAIQPETTKLSSAIVLCKTLTTRLVILIYLTLVFSIFSKYLDLCFSYGKFQISISKLFTLFKFTICPLLSKPWNKVTMKIKWEIVMVILQDFALLHVFLELIDFIVVLKHKDIETRIRLRKEWHLLIQWFMLSYFFSDYL